MFHFADTGNCICGEGGIEDGNWTWANLTFVGDARLAIEAGFDSMKVRTANGPEPGHFCVRRLHGLLVGYWIDN